MIKIIFTALLAFPAVAFAQNSFTIKGKVTGANPPSKVYLAYTSGQTRVTDSTTVVKGAFEFKGSVTDPVNATLSNTPARPQAGTQQVRGGGGNGDRVTFYIENAVISVHATDSLKYAAIVGSKSNDDDQKLRALLKNNAEKKAALSAEMRSITPAERQSPEYPARLKAIGDRSIALTNEESSIYAKFINDNLNSFIALNAFKSTLPYNFETATVEPKFNKFTAGLKNSNLGKSIQSSIEKSRGSQIGVVTNFTQNDANDKPVSLSDFRGKYTLVDFWASWCGPCRAENPNVVAAYNKFKDKGFTVLGVSYDGGNKKTTKEAWLKAVADDKLTWTQVSDLQGGANSTATQYGITAIPFNFLVDPSGKIIARDLRGDALDKKLEELLGSKSQ